MNGSKVKKMRREVRKAYGQNEREMYARVLTDIEANPDFALMVNTNAISKQEGWLNRTRLRISHAWRVIDCSPVVRVRRRRDVVCQQEVGGMWRDMTG